MTPDLLARDPVAFLHSHAPWLFERRFGVCLVGSQALALACQRADTTPPLRNDIDLSWALDVEAGRSVLEPKGIFLPTTAGNLERGTLACKIGGHRIEITTLRGSESEAPLAQRIAADLAARDMTIGALAVELATGAIHDPHGGLADFRARRIAPVGDPITRVREHPVRWIRYYRKAHEWGFEIDRSIRRMRLSPATLDPVPKEALSAELREVLLNAPSPGRFFLDLHETGLLEYLSPELDLQFDGRPAGPQRWHPEISQSLHLVLSLEWAAANARHLDPRDRLAVMVSVLCHDLGKGYTKAQELPGHSGHERRGLAPLDRVLARFPAIADPRCRALARCVCELHVIVRHFDELRAGTIARLYDRHFRAKDFPVELFAIAVGADSGGRLGLADSGMRTRDRVLADLLRIRATCDGVDSTALRAKHADLDEFRRALHEARARALSDVEGDGDGEAEDSARRRA